MAVAAGPDEIADFQVALLRDHVRQQCVRRNVERHAQEDVRAALVELAGKASAGDVELEQQVAGWQFHPRNFRDVPCRHDQSPRVRIAADLREQVGDLVDVRAVRRRPRPPLIAIDGSQVAVGVGPLVPYRHAVGLEVRGIGVPGQEPQELMDDRPGVNLFRGQQRKAGTQVEAHLVSEYRERAGSRAVVLAVAVVAHVAHEIEVGLHRTLSVAL